MGCEIKLFFVSYFLLLESIPVTLNEFLLFNWLILRDLDESKRELSVILMFLDLLLFNDWECWDLKKTFWVLFWEFYLGTFSLKSLFLVEFVKKVGTIFMLGLCFFKEKLDLRAAKISLLLAESLIFFSMITCKDTLHSLFVETYFSTTSESL